MRKLYVLYDAHCGLCSRVRRWAENQPALVELEFVRADSADIARRFPGLSRPGTPEELVVVSDDGCVYRDSHAWIMCLYALEEFREWSFRFARPALMPFARHAFHMLSQNRRRISRLLGLVSDVELTDVLRGAAVEACEYNPQHGWRNHG